MTAVAFEKELEIFRQEAQSAAQFLYAYLSIHETAARRREVHALLDKSALFWNTNLSALQTAAFIALGRAFDTDSNHNIGQLLRIAQNNRNIFLKPALGVRKQALGLSAADTVNYLVTAYEPSVQDFRDIRKRVNKQRTIYEAKYRNIRHQWFAHRNLADANEASVLFAQTNTRELQKLVTFLVSLYDALWNLYFNGYKPSFQQNRYSVKAMRNRPSPERRITNVQERITHEAAEFLRMTAGVKKRRRT
jgi:hypothetical protein